MGEKTTRLYLDNAATSFPKPPGVHEAVLRYMTEVGASPGRGAYAESVEGARVIRRCRERLARLFHASSADHVVFTLNTSDALNLAIRGVVSHARRSGRGGRPVHVVTTAMEHNSVLRPLNALAADGLSPPVRWTCVEADAATGLVDPAALRAAMTADTALAAVVHASNVTGTVQRVADFGEVCRRGGVPLLVDAAQSAGRLAIDVEAMGIDLLAFPGHKALLGPLGTGGLVIRPGLEARLDPLREGGTGSASESDVQPLTLPDRYEPGSHNTPGIAGLSEGVGWLLERGVERIAAEERAVTERMLALTSRSPGLRLLGPSIAAARIGVFTFALEGVDPHEAAAVLETEFGVLARAGIHCAPRAHGTFGTRGRGGGLRLSFGAFNTPDDAVRAASALREIAAGLAAV